MALLDLSKVKIDFEQLLGQLQSHLATKDAWKGFLATQTGETLLEAVAAVGTLKPSASLAAVIGDGTYARTEVVKKIWDYIKANGLQDPANKRSIKADGKLQAVFGKDQATMFELAGIIGKHLS